MILTLSRSHHTETLRFQVMFADDEFFLRPLGVRGPDLPVSMSLGSLIAHWALEEGKIVVSLDTIEQTLSITRTGSRPENFSIVTERGQTFEAQNSPILDVLSEPQKEEMYSLLDDFE